MPAEVFGPDHAFLHRDALLSYEEITRVARVFVGLGVRKLRLTGGEPLVRRDVATLVASLSAIDGVDDIALTTNGLLLGRHAAALRAAGLSRLTLSLDALDEATFSKINGRGVAPGRVLAGLAAAERAGFESVKINAVIQRGINEHAIIEMVEHFRGTGHVVRFIEYMDVGETNGWRTDDVVSESTIVARVNDRYPLELVPPRVAGETARRYRFLDGQGEIGVIASVTRPFCRGCVRARLSAKGELFTCLFGATGVDLRSALRASSGDEALRALVHDTWRGRTDRYSEQRRAGEATQKVEMSYIGG